MFRHLCLLSFISASLLCICCTKEAEKNGTAIRSNLIDAFVTPNHLVLIQDSENPQIIVLQDESLVEDTYRDPLRNKAIGDVFYNQETEPGRFLAYDWSLSCIQVYSLTDTKEENVSERVQFFALSPYNWLSSKGQETYDWTRVNNEMLSFLRQSAEPALFPVADYLPNLLPEELSLLITRPVFFVIDKDLLDSAPLDLLFTFSASFRVIEIPTTIVSRP